MKNSRMTFIGALIFGAAIAFGQAAGPGAQGGTTNQGTTPPQKGQKGQGKGLKQGGKLMAFMGGGPRLLLNETVQKDLRMTLSQIEKAKAAVGGMQDRRNAPLPGAGQKKDKAQRKAGGIAQMREKMREDGDKKVREILDDAQFARYGQIELQTEGAGALARKDVAEKVGLSSDQVAQIQRIQQDQMLALRDALQASKGSATPGAGKGARGAMAQELMKMRDETNAKIMSVLNQSQRKKWDSLLGPAIILK